VVSVSVSDVTGGGAATLPIEGEGAPPVVFATLAASGVLALRGAANVSLSDVTSTGEAIVGQIVVTIRTLLLCRPTFVTIGCDPTEQMLAGRPHRTMLTGSPAQQTLTGYPNRTAIIGRAKANV
jgi:hypothetical protein